MSNFTNFWLILSLCLCYQCSPSPDAETNTSPPLPDQSELLQRIALFNQAFEQGDVDQLAEMITADYQHTNGHSAPIGKNDWLAYLRKRKAQIDSGELVVHSYEMLAPKINLFSCSALVTARIEVSSSRAGQQQDNAYQVSNIWVLEDGLWKRAGFHDGKIQ